jgi:hypothetical protein
MRVLMSLLLIGWIAAAGEAQEVVPAPPPSAVGSIAAGQAANEAANIAAQSATSVTNIAAPGVGLKPGGFFHALSTTRQGICLKLKQSPIGGLIAEMRKPLSTVTGGLIAPTAKPVPAEIAAAGPQGTAAQIQAIKLDAPKRVDAVKQLAFIDVRYHPEAAQTLVAALRADPSECVRLEAARTIATLKTCTKPIAEALRICVESVETDGNPAELSPAVRRQAAQSLSCCLNCLSDSQPTQSLDIRPEYPVTPAAYVEVTPVVGNRGDEVRSGHSTMQNPYYRSLDQVHRMQVDQASRETLVRHASLLEASSSTSTVFGTNEASPSPEGIFEIWKASRK